MKQTFWLPTRPYTLIDAVNRMALATGSTRSATAGSVAGYNGHSIQFVKPNKLKPYWTCYYTWDGIRTIGRGSLESCLQAAKAEYDKGARGANAYVTVTTEEDAAKCLAAGFQPWSKEIEAAHHATFMDGRWDAIHTARDLERHGIVPGAVGMLVNSKTVEEFKAQVDVFIARQRAERAVAQ
jgi:hypothetical protein